MTGQARLVLGDSVHTCLPSLSITAAFFILPIDGRLVGPELGGVQARGLTDGSCPEPMAQTCSDAEKYLWLQLQPAK